MTVGLLLLFTSVFIVADCGYINSPSYTPGVKTIDCSNQEESCHVTLVIEALESMSFFEYENGHRKWQGFRAIFNETSSEFDVACLETYYKPPPPKEQLQPPIVTDGYFRPIFTINGQMPGPTIVANENQQLHITVYNELKNSEGIAIHWHGMHQVNNSEMDGVPYITQYPIAPNQKMTYRFRAYPSGTHWYHAHGGTQRTDGIYGAFIVKDKILEMELEDIHEEHTLLLMDWTRDTSRDIGQQILSSLNFWKEPQQDVCSTQYSATHGPDFTKVGPFPFWSGIINDRGRHCDEYNEFTKECTHYNLPSSVLNHFSVLPNKLYRFRLIGAQSAYAFKFSIQDHLLTVVATDGYPIRPIRNVKYVIVNTGERYDVVVDTHRTIQNIDVSKYWILAETLEHEFTGNEEFHSPLGEHKAEGILQYNINQESELPIQEPSRTWNCTRESPCRVINCPFASNGFTENVLNYNCINVHEFESGPVESVPLSIRAPNIIDNTLFYNFDFYGEKSTNASSVDGINFRYPADPPVVDHERFEANKDDYICPGRGCPHRLLNPDVPFCACTHQIDLSSVHEGDAVQIVISNINTLANNGRLKLGSSHSVHLHGHSFYVVKTGYPEYNPDGTVAAFNRDLECIDVITNKECDRLFAAIERKGNAGHNTKIQEIRWRNKTMGIMETADKPLSIKDTVVVPYGGYVAIRFVINNPGWWFFHCHIETHQLEGMAAVITELPSRMLQKEDASAAISVKTSPTIIGMVLLLLLKLLL